MIEIDSVSEPQLEATDCDLEIYLLLWSQMLK